MRKFILVLIGTNIHIGEGLIDQSHEYILNTILHQHPDAKILGGGFKKDKILFSYSVDYGPIQPHVTYISQFLKKEGLIFITQGLYGSEDLKFFSRYFNVLG